jgi:hypothetical protein
MARANIRRLTGKVTRRGRPALDDAAPSVSLHVRLSGAQYDATYAGARAARLPLATFVRGVLRDAVKGKGGSL